MIARLRIRSASIGKIGKISVVGSTKASSYEESATVVFPKIYKMEANKRTVIVLIGKNLANGVGMTL